jgi:hypothetical protein
MQMRRLAARLLIAVSLLGVAATAALAQDRRYGRDDREQYGPNPVDRALMDLDRARPGARGHERDHFNQARRDLEIFRDHWARHDFDKDRLDGAIENLQSLADSRHLHPRDREILGRDADALRDFRRNRGYRSYRR